MASDGDFKKEEDTNGAIKKVMNEVKCSKNFICYTSGFKTLCKAQNIGDSSFLGCLVERLEDDPQNCQFARKFQSR